LYVLGFFVFLCLTTALWPLHEFKAAQVGVFAIAIGLTFVGVYLLLTFALQHRACRLQEKPSRPVHELWDEQLDH
jgi:hypothetical protein